MYTLRDPTGGTYNDVNFTDILNIGLYAANQGREVVFYPEGNIMLSCLLLVFVSFFFYCSGILG